MPPGIAHPIGALMAHTVHTEDFMLNTTVGGTPPLREREGWGAKLVGDMLLGQEAGTARAYRCDQQQMTEYAQAVFASTDTILSHLTDQELERELDLVRFGFPNTMMVGVFLSQMILGNSSAHTGEISALKGEMSLKGYPF